MNYLGWFLLLCVTSVYAATPLDTRYKRETVTLDYFLESCTVIGETANGMIPHFDCESYLYGVLDAHSAVRDTLPLQQRACFPTDLAPWQVYQDVLLGLSDNQGSQNAAFVIINTLRVKYPCP